MECRSRLSEELQTYIAQIHTEIEKQGWGLSRKQTVNQAHWLQSAFSKVF